jgi:two-component system cell cycle sensor histidine kinase/response regulator CckA
VSSAPLLFCAAVLAMGLILAMISVARHRRLLRQWEEQAGELSKQRALLQAVHDHLPTAMTVVAAMGEGFRLISLNREAGRLFAIDAQSAAGKLVAQLPFPPWAAGLWEEAARRRPSGAETVQYEQPLEQDGRVFLVTMAPLKHYTRATELWCVLMEDVTARKQLDAEIAQSRRLRAVGELVGGIAHEFNNLLTPVMLKVGEIQIDRPADAGLQADVAIIATAAQRGAELTRRLLTFGRRPDAGDEAVRLEEAIGSCFDLLQNTVDRRIRWESAVPPGLPPLRFSGSDLNQVVINLLLNARDTLLEKLERPPNEDWTPHIHVSVALLAPDAALFEGVRPGALVGWQRLTVGDNGMGIAPNVTERVFEPFYSTKGVGKGMGLGLATVWHLVTQVGGRVELDTQLGFGSTFHLLFPVWAVNDVSPPRPPPPARVAGARVTVLMVEDDPLVAAAVEGALKREGVSVVPFPDGAEAKRHLAEHHAQYDALVVDINLPGASGIDLLTRARELNYAGRVLVMSGRLGPEELATLRRLKVDRVLDKPFSGSEFSQALARVLG